MHMGAFLPLECCSKQTIRLAHADGMRIFYYFTFFFVILRAVMEDERRYYVDVLLPLHLPGTYTYRVPKEYVGQVSAGCRVVVQFGKQKLYSAVVRRVHCEAPEWKAKYVLAVLDERPVVTETQMEFWEWVAQYYMCHVGDVMAFALPAGMKIASESAIAIHPDFDGELSGLTKHERMVVQLLADHPVMRVEDVGLALGVQKIMPLIRTMIERSIIVMDEELKQRYKPKTSTYVRLGEGLEDEEKLEGLFKELEMKRRTKQVEVLMQFLQLSHFGKEKVAKRELPQGAPLQALIRSGALVTEECVVSSVQCSVFSDSDLVSPETIVLNEEQENSEFRIRSSELKSVWLLHGVTSSGKTEVYIKLIADVVKEGRQALLLLPEIALTAQVVNRLKRFFGDKAGVYHSRFSASQRVEIWKRTLAEGPEGLDVIIGARSALMLPFKDLGLIIVDEEHDQSYKQQDPAPRYNARDAAVWLGKRTGAKVVLGSATPSIETYHNAQTGRYGLATLTRRYGGFTLPKVEVVDLKEAYRKGEMKGHFSATLLRAIEEALEAKRQVILFQNRRGFSLRLECSDCHHTPQCVHCDVSLVYHKATNSLRCHYCGYSIPVPTECPACHSTQLRMVGIGTERVEEDLQIMYPEARVARMDLDSTLQRNRYLELLEDFGERRIDILVGTQMVTKGLDFENVGVVGIVNADGMISYPNFRSYERAFQQMTQVSGRAGRRGDGGKVYIQTFNPMHQVLEYVERNDYRALYEEQIEERRIFMYPPFYRLIEITLRHREQATVDRASGWLAAQAKATFGNRVIGPEYPLVSRIRALYLKRITIRFEKGEAIAEAKEVLRRMSDDLAKQEGMSGVGVVFDVDPV